MSLTDRLYWNSLISDTYLIVYFLWRLHLDLECREENNCFLRAIALVLILIHHTDGQPLGHQ